MNSTVLSLKNGLLSQILFSNRMKVMPYKIKQRRSIKTQGGPRKGKLSVVKKKIDSNFNMEAIETEDAASVVKKFNFENKHLFGGIIGAVQRTCDKLSGESKKRRQKLSSTSVMTYSETSIPLQDIKLDSVSNRVIQSDISSPFLLTDRVLGSILNFPLEDKLQSTKEANETITKCNYLRQCLEKMNNNKKLPSVTTILERTVPPERAAILENWKLSMIEKMGQESFEKYQKDMLFNGSSLHQCITGYLSRIPELQAEVLPAITGHWESLQSVLPSVKEVRLLEENVTHPFLSYKGVVDCLAKFGEHFVVIDWKTSQKPKLSLSSTYDTPLQIAAYVGALNFDPKFKYMVSKGLIVIAYENGTAATVHFLNESSLLDYWNKWLQRLRTYWEKVQTENL